VTEVAERYGVSRQSVHTWLLCYRQEEIAGLEERFPSIVGQGYDHKVRGGQATYGQGNLDERFWEEEPTPASAQPYWPPHRRGRVNQRLRRVLIDHYHAKEKQHEQYNKPAHQNAPSKQEGDNRAKVETGQTIRGEVLPLRWPSRCIGKDSIRRLHELSRIISVLVVGALDSAARVTIEE
jgi:hypothetical protein